MDNIAILLVDSADAGLAELAALLKRHGYRTQRVSEERDAVAALAGHEPKLVFIDLRHPQATGICQRLRDTPVGAITPVIMMGAQGAGITCVADALGIGADFYFDGPWRDDALLAKVRTYVGDGDMPVIHAPPAPVRSRAPRAAGVYVDHALDDDLNDDPGAGEAGERAACGDRSDRSDDAAVAAAAAGTRDAEEAAEEAAMQAASTPDCTADAELVRDVPAPKSRLHKAFGTSWSKQSAPAGLPDAPGVDLTERTRPPPLPSAREMARRRAEAPTREVAAQVVSGVPGAWDLAPPAGALDEATHVAGILAQAWQAQATGRMDWHQGDVRVCLWLYEGSPCGYSSNLAHDHVGEFLLRTGSIRQAAGRQLHLQNLPNPRLTLAYLVRLGEMSAERVWPLLTAHLAEQTYGLFAWETGTYAWHRDVMPLEDRLTPGVPTPAWLMEGLRRKYDMQRLVPHLGGPATMVVTQDYDDASAVNLRLGDAEARIIRLFDGNRTLRDIAGSAGMALDEVYRVALLLVMLRHAQVAVRGAAGAATAAGLNPVHDAQRITEKLQQARLSDYFEILGISATAGDREIAHAAEVVREAFHPGSFSHDVRLQYAAELGEIAEIVADAREVLADPGKREAYAAGVV